MVIESDRRQDDRHSCTNCIAKDHKATLYELGLEYEKVCEVRSSLFISFIKGGLMKRMREDSSIGV